MAKMKMPAAKIHADSHSLTCGLIRFNRKCFENLSIPIAMSSKQKIAIISLGKMPNG